MNPEKNHLKLPSLYILLFALLAHFPVVNGQDLTTAIPDRHPAMAENGSGPAAFEDGGFWDAHYVRDLGFFFGEHDAVHQLIDLNATYGGNPVLGVKEGQSFPGFVMSVQLQEDFNSAVRDPLPATFSWARDLKTGVNTTDYTIDAALVANIYIPSVPILGFNPYGAAQHYRLGGGHRSPRYG